MKRRSTLILILTLGLVLQFGFATQSTIKDGKVTDVTNKVDTTVDVVSPEVTENVEATAETVESEIIEEVESATENKEIEDKVVKFNDENLEEAIRDMLGKRGDLTQTELLNFEGNLDLRGKNITDLTGIEFVSNVTTLFLADNMITDLSPLSHLSKLEYLDVSRNKITNLSDLATLTNLKNLLVQGNNIVDLSPLKNLTQLQSLYASNNKITNLSGLAKLTNLATLTLEQNKITDLSPLSNLNKLSYLVVNGNKISNLAPIVHFTDLYELHLSDNNIKDINLLSKLPNLEMVQLEKNPVSIDQGTPAFNTIQNLMDNNVVVIHDHLVVLNVKRVTKDSITVKWDISEKFLSFGTGFYDISLSLNGEEIKTFHDLKNSEHTFTNLEKGKDYKVSIQLQSGSPFGLHVITKELSVKTEDVHTSQRVMIKPTISGNLATISYDDINSVGEKGILEIDLRAHQEAQVSLTSEQIKMLQDNKITVEINKGDVAVKILAHLLGNDKDVKILMERQEREKGALSAVYDFTIETDEGNISSFLEPVILIFPVDESKVTNTENVKVWYFNPETKEWENIGGTYSNGFVTAETNHFSTFAVFENNNASGGTGNDADDGSSIEGGDTETNPKTKTIEEEEEVVTDALEETEIASGKVLPNTATNTMNFLILGILFTILAIGLIYMQKRRKAV